MPTPKKEKVVFKSKYAEYRVVLRATDYDIIGRNKVRVPGKDAQFHNGLYATEDAETIQLLREHRSYGVDFVEMSEANQIADNPLPVEPKEPIEPPAVKPQRIGARSSKDAK